MSTNEYISIPIDSELKTESDCILADIGLSTQVVVSMLLRTIVRNKAIPTELFTIDSKAANNAAYLAKLDRSFAEYERGWECKIVCVKSNCADLFYAPYWGKQLKGWISYGKT